jgi:hypothetical protein
MDITVFKIFNQLDICPTSESLQRIFRVVAAITFTGKKLQGKFCISAELMMVSAAYGGNIVQAQAMAFAPMQAFGGGRTFRGGRGGGKSFRQQTQQQVN